jgi:C-terminal processing protease CtpA/Prc
VAVLDFDAFGDAPGSEPKFLARLEEGFRRLREEKVPHLVLDLRGNGGGRDMYGATLVSYLCPEPFGYFERITVTPAYAGEGRVEEHDGRRLMLSHDGLQVQQPAAFRFQGDVCILIDGETFSTAADVATVAHANGLATFFGEETGGGYEGNNSGSSEFLRLPNSGVGVNVPHWNYRTAGIAAGHEGRGVEPDFPVRATIEDVLAERDVVMERALEHLRGAKR